MHNALKSLPLAAAVLLAASTVNAQLVHRYDLSTVNDSVGGANGTLNGNATLANGMLTTTGTDNTSYLNLPTSVGTGITGDFTIQTFTSTTNAGTNYSTAFSLSTSQTVFILLNANRPNVNATTADFQQATSTPNQVLVSGGSPLLADGTEHDLVITYTSATGAVSIYNNGTLAGTGNIGAGFSLQTSTAGGFDGINGHAPFTNDNTYAGSTDDFRIYSQALTASQVTALDTLGANATNAQISAAVPEPSPWVAVLTGLAALGGLQRFRRLQA